MNDEEKINLMENFIYNLLRYIGDYEVSEILEYYSDGEGLNEDQINYLKKISGD